MTVSPLRHGTGTVAAPPPYTTVHLVRHGEVFNPDKILYGRLAGFHLSEAGEEQARVTAAHLSRNPIAAVISSPLERARQTAGAIAAACGLEISIDHRLIESENVFEGTTVEPGPGLLRHPAKWKHMRNPFRPSWGEPYDEVARRMLGAVAEWRDAYPAREVVLVSHQLPVWTARRALEGRRLWHRPDRRQCALASVTSAVYDGERLAFVGYVEPNGPGRTSQGSVGA